MSVNQTWIFIPIVGLMMQNTREKQSYIMTKTAKIEHTKKSLAKIVAGIEQKWTIVITQNTNGKMMTF